MKNLLYIIAILTLIMNPPAKKNETISDVSPNEMEDLKVCESDFKGMEITDDDIRLIAWITMGEAEGECEEGKRLVIDTILNRVDHQNFPNSINEVIYQPSQFSCVWDGRLNRTSATEEVCQLVREELNNRTNYDVLFFTAGEYGKYGTHLFQVENHYFCGE